MATSAPSATSAAREPRVDFLGYGPEVPESVFVAYEEYCPAEAMNVCHAAHRRFPARYDKNKAVRVYAHACRQANLHDEAGRFDAALQPGDVPTWRFAAMLLHALRGQGTWQQEYDRLGTLRGSSFLCEIFPVARPWRRHPVPNERVLQKQHIEILRREVIQPLRRGTLIVSYFNPAFLVGRMQRRGRRAWTRIAEGVTIATTERFVVLRVPFPRAGDAYPWLPDVAAAVRREIVRLAVPEAKVART